MTHRYKKPDATFDVREVVTKTFAYDEAGNLISQTDANGHTTRFEYDAMNRRTAVIDATDYHVPDPS